jgi:hypothetical protein
VRLGILADIHEHVDHLRRALTTFARQGVDQVVVLGDVFELGHHLAETILLLDNAGASGVWGNHDFGLCTDPTEEMRSRYGEQVVNAMGRLRPRLEIDGCLFTHVEPWLDPESLEDLWWFEGHPDTPERASQSFAAVPHQFLFVGHFHRWFVVTPDRTSFWERREAMILDPDQRYLVGIHAVVNGRCAVFDTATRRLVPIDVRQQA